ncbi:MAG: SufS family cysteine desulfurase [Treponema sp.]|nr:SufS family cysteine desulfurase [Treponema sp.]
MRNVRNDFPLFSSPENAGLIYLDSAATAQRPACVTNAIRQFYAVHNANPLRGLYDLSVRATEWYESARHTVARFINAHEDAEIIFTRNASESLNLVAYSWGMANIAAGDEIVVSIMEHHSNILPWQMVAQANGAQLIWLECDRETGALPLDRVRAAITDRTKLVALTHVSNVLGVTNPVKAITDIAHSHGAVVVVDGAQSTPHIPVDVTAIDADFFAFSGHKLMGPTGIGVLYGKRSLLDAMPPFLRGGEMIEYVTRDSATWAALPAKFEAGTVNVGGAVGLAAAIDYLSELGMDTVAQHDDELTAQLMSGMHQTPHVHVIGSPNPAEHCGIVTFTIDDVHPHDIASILDSEHIAIRAGHHCAQPLGAYLGIAASARVSLYLYNTNDEVARFLAALKKIRTWMGLPD